MAVITKDADSVTLVLNGHAFTSFGVGDIITITPVNPQTSQVNSSDGGVSINTRSDANVYDLKMTIQKFSDDDVFLNSIINSGTTILTGSMKEDFNSDGTDGQESWTLEGGSITTKPSDTKNDTDGNATLEYTVKFRNAKRAL
jgi:hypothetical protein